jgi:predicted Zn-dependent protease
VSKSLFESIGYRLGQKAAQAKNAFDLMGGTEEESLRAEVRLGRDLTAALLERTPLIEENESTRFAAQIQGWLAAKVKQKKLPFGLWVTADRGMSTLALPGGSVFLSWPLLNLCHGERDEIAFVLGHEMAHIVLRHALDRIVKDAAVSLLLRQSSTKGAASAWLGKAGQKLMGQPYSIDEDFEADSFAVALIRTAGQSSPQSPSLAGDYLATHPPAQARLDRLRVHAA